MMLVRFVFGVSVLGAMACNPVDKLDEGQPEGTQAGDCTDGADNDGDGFFDCDDSGCAGSPVCRDADADADADSDADADADADSDADADADSDADADGGPVEVDEDGDGYDTSIDCDDSDRSVNPAADEICDGKDNDCNGEVDDNPVDGETYYDDQDRDGYGDPDYSVRSCAPVCGYVSNDQDCDDFDSDIRPGAAESCDGVDEDCNGEIDEGLPTTVYYADVDGDGFGDASDAVDSCAPVDGRVEDNTDCDDSSPTAFPGGIERSFNGIDEDCDGYDIDFLECAEDSLDEGVGSVTSYWYGVAGASGSIPDPIFGFLSIGSYTFDEGYMYPSYDSHTISPTADYDVFDVSVILALNLEMDLYAEESIGGSSTDCELAAGPVRVNYSGTLEVNPYSDHATSTVYLSATVLDDPSSMTYFEGCSLDIIDLLLDLADVDFSVTSMVDDRVNEVAVALEAYVEADIEAATEAVCVP